MTDDIATEAPLALREHSRKVLGKFVWLRRVLQIAAIGCTVGAGVLEVVAGKSDTWTTADTSQIFLLSVAGVIGGLLLVFDDSSPSLLVAADKAARHADETDQIADSLVDELSDTAEELVRAQIIFGTSNIFDEVIDAALQNRHDPEQRKKILYTLLEVLVQSKMALFEMGDELWNFSIYYWDDEKKVLVLQACRRSSRLNEDGPHREFGSGQGHVGKTFQERTRLICPDSQDATVKKLYDAPPGLYQPDDDEKYRSLAAFPIMLNPDSQPIGVVEVTSDVRGRFTHEDATAAFPKYEPLAALARTLATLNAIYTFTERKEAM